MRVNTYIVFLFLLIFVIGLIVGIGFNRNKNIKKNIEIEKKMEKRVRESVIAGSWYPGSKDELKGMLNGFLNNVKKEDIEGLRALISPHAGYMYSGQVAAYGYKQIEGKYFKKVIIMGPSHHYPFYGVSIPNYTHYRTPLGDVPISEDAKEMIGESDLIKSIEEAHSKEHSVEIEIPFLQMTLSNFTIIPMVFGHLNSEDIKRVADVILRHFERNTLIVVSTDLSHYHPYSDAVRMDKNCIDAIISLDIRDAYNGEMCGKYPVLTLMEIAKRINLSAKLLRYANSGDVIGDKSGGVVGYASIVFYENNTDNGVIGKEQQRYLLKIARNAIKTYLDNGKVLDVEPKYDELNVRKGTFVTLEKHGELRGCIGNILPDKPIYLSVRDNAINAAFRDPRFKPLESDELDDIEIEISILSLPELIKADTPEDYLRKIERDRDGIIIKYMGKSATYLPQVWEKIPDKERFLESLCYKAWLPGDCWKKKGVEIYRYRVQAFKESEL